MSLGLGTIISYWPWLSVDVPVVVPTIAIFTPGSVSPVASSVTVPLTVNEFCAYTEPAKSKRDTVKKMGLLRYDLKQRKMKWAGDFVCIELPLIKFNYISRLIFKNPAVI